MENAGPFWLSTQNKLTDISSYGNLSELVKLDIDCFYKYNKMCCYVASVFSTQLRALFG